MDNNIDILMLKSTEPLRPATPWNPPSLCIKYSIHPQPVPECFYPSIHTIHGSTAKVFVMGGGGVYLLPML